jgi:hypothetical protein
MTHLTGTELCSACITIPPKTRNQLSSYVASLHIVILRLITLLGAVSRVANRQPSARPSARCC